MTRKRKEFPYIREYYNYGCGSRGQSPWPGWTTWWFSFPLSFPEMGRPENPEEKTSLLRSDSRKVPPIFSSSGRTFLPAFRSLRRLQVAVSPI